MGSNNKACNRVLTLLLLVAFVLCPPLLAQDNVARTKQLLKGLYPDLKGQSPKMKIWDDLPFDTPGGLSSFVIDLESTSSHSTQAQSSSILTAAIAFFLDGNLFSMVVQGSVVRDAENEKMREVVNSHPEWNDEQIAAALKSAGARYGPGERTALLASLPTDALHTVLGDFRIFSVHFHTRPEQIPGEKFPEADLYWSVKLETLGKNPRQYFLFAEPFDGRIFDIGKIG